MPESSDVDQMIAQCGGCRFWKQDAGFVDVEPTPNGSFGDCARTRANYRFRADGDATITETLALALADYDVAGYGAVLRTHATFGCIQWELRPSRDPSAVLTD